MAPIVVFMPTCWNFGRLARLRSGCPKGRVGSIPSVGTICTRMKLVKTLAVLCLSLIVGSAHASPKQGTLTVSQHLLPHTGYRYEVELLAKERTQMLVQVADKQAHVRCMVYRTGVVDPVVMADAIGGVCNQIFYSVEGGKYVFQVINMEQVDTTATLIVQ